MWVHSFPDLSRSFLPNSNSLAQWPKLSQGHLVLEVSKSHTMTHHSWQNSSGRGIGPSQRPSPDNTHHSQETDFHLPRGFRTRNPSKQAAADPRLKRLGHWDRLQILIITPISKLQVLKVRKFKTQNYTHKLHPAQLITYTHTSKSHVSLDSRREQICFHTVRRHFRDNRYTVITIWFAFWMKYKRRVKLSRYRPEQAHGDPEG